MDVLGTPVAGTVEVLGMPVAATSIVVGIPAAGISIKILQWKCRLPIPRETWKTWQLASQTQSRRLKLPKATTHLQTSALCRQMKASHIGMQVAGTQVAGVAVVGAGVPLAPGTLVAATLVAAGMQQVGTCTRKLPQ